MVELHTSYGIRYVNPWHILYIEPQSDTTCLVKLPAADDRFYTLSVEEPADKLAERCAVAMSRPFPKPSSSKEIHIAVPWVSRPKE